MDKCLVEAAVEAGQVAGEHGVGRFEVDRRRAPQLRHQAILERPPEALDATLRLRAVGTDRAHPDLSEGASTWVRERCPVSCSVSVGGRLVVLLKMPWRSVYSASGRPTRRAVWPSIRK